MAEFPFALALAAAFVTSAFGQSESAESIPDFSGIWAHANPGFEPLASGPTALINRSRRPNGTGDGLKLTGDYTNPILKPEAAEIVKKHGERALNMGDPNPHNQCWLEGPPFVFTNHPNEIVQTRDKVVILYQDNSQVRHVRMNQTHPAQVTPTWYGDSVGHYEGDTLVIDTVGMKVGRYSMVDWYGTPHSEALHVVERYRMLDYEAAKEGFERDAKEHNVPPGMPVANPQGQVSAAPLHGRGQERLHDAVERDHDVSICRQRPAGRLGGTGLRRKPLLVPGKRGRCAAGGQAGFLIGA